MIKSHWSTGLLRTLLLTLFSLALYHTEASAFLIKEGSPCLDSPLSGQSWLAH